MIKVAALIQARMASTRLPGKVVADICGHPALSRIAERLRHAKRLDALVVATSAGPDCEPVREVASRYTIPCFSGSELDLIDRLHRAALWVGADAVVRVTADNPLVDPRLVDQMVTTYLSAREGFDAVVNYLPPTFPHGLELEVYSTALLGRLSATIIGAHDREWFPTYITGRPHEFRIGRVTNSPDLSSLRWTMDYPEDLEFCRAVFSELWRPGAVFGMADILALLERRPDLVALNAQHAQHASTAPAQMEKP